MGKIVEFSAQSEELFDALDLDQIKKKKEKTITGSVMQLFFKQDRNGYGKY